VETYWYHRALAVKTVKPRKKGLFTSEFGRRKNYGERAACSYRRARSNALGRPLSRENLSITGDPGRIKRPMRGWHTAGLFEGKCLLDRVRVGYLMGHIDRFPALARSRSSAAESGSEELEKNSAATHAPAYLYQPLSGTGDERLAPDYARGLFRQRIVEPVRGLQEPARSCRNASTALGTPRTQPIGWQQQGSGPCSSAHQHCEDPPGTSAVRDGTPWRPQGHP